VDDTMKDSQVLSKPKLLQKTLLGEASEITGMRDLFKRLHIELKTPVVFKVSGSPFQLKDLIQKEFVKKLDFPGGVVQLQNMTASTMTKFFKDSATEDFKKKQISEITDIYKEKDWWYWLGDSTQRDPEVYAAKYVLVLFSFLYYHKHTNKLTPQKKGTKKSKTFVSGSDEIHWLKKKTMISVSQRFSQTMVCPGSNGNVLIIPRN
jgi:hypothetical protein